MEQPNKYRSRIDIMAAILHAAAKKNNASITQLTYGSLLSHRQIISHLQPLITEKLLEHKAKTFSITPKGREFLEIYENLVKVLMTI
jgi:predicted transcriptional regulator